MNLIKLNAIASTNTHLKELGAATLIQDGTIVWALSQTKGRGQMGSGWVSKAGESLTFSMLKRFKNLAVNDHIYVNLGVSLGVAKALEKLNVPQLQIKWPNDILSYNKKICGILIENQISAEFIQTSIIGIGLNVNESYFTNLPQAGSLYLATGKKFDLERVLHSISKNIMKQFDRIEAKDFEQLKSDYEDMLFRKDEVSVFEDGSGHRFNGIIKGVSKSGNLIVELENARQKEFSLKEIKLLF